MTIADLENKNILILGLGREGFSVANFLRKHYPEKKIIIWDQSSKDKISEEFRSKIESDPQVEIRYSVGYWRKNSTLNDFDLIIKSAGIPLKNLPKEVLPKVSSETELFFEFCPGKIIGVTGTKGKSTTSALIYEVLSSSNKKTVLLGNIGNPALDYLEQIDQNTFIAFELSSHQLQTLKKSPHIAILLNFYPEHLDFYESLDDYFQAKLNIARHQNKEDFLIYNSDNAEIEESVKSFSSKKIPINAKLAESEIPLLRQSKLLGDFYSLNVLAAHKVVEILGISQKVFENAVRNFQPLLHRLEFFGEFKGIKFYNDSISTIPETTIAALDTLGNEVETLFLGGFDRGVDYEKLVERLKTSKVKNLILFPTTGQKIWKEIKLSDPQAEKKYKHFEATNMETAVKFAFEHTSPGKVALLSPATSSFSLFKDYIDRGLQFKQEILKRDKLSAL